MWICIFLPSEFYFYLAAYSFNYFKLTDAAAIAAPYPKMNCELLSWIFKKTKEREKNQKTKKWRKIIHPDMNAHKYNKKNERIELLK